MGVPTSGGRKAIQDQMALLEEVLGQLRAADEALAKLEDGGPAGAAMPGTKARPISLANATQLALRAQGGAAPVAEVIVWVKRNYDQNAKPHSIRSTLTYLKKKGVVGKGGKNWYHMERKESPTDE